MGAHHDWRPVARLRQRDPGRCRGSPPPWLAMHPHLPCRHAYSQLNIDFSSPLQAHLLTGSLPASACGTSCEATCAPTRSVAPWAAVVAGHPPQLRWSVAGLGDLSAIKGPHARLAVRLQQRDGGRQFVLGQRIQYVLLPGPRLQVPPPPPPSTHDILQASCSSRVCPGDTAAPAFDVWIAEAAAGTWTALSSANCSWKVAGKGCSGGCRTTRAKTH